MSELKISFKMKSEALFEMLSRFLPINDLNIEEYPDQHVVERNVAVHKKLAAPPQKKMNHFKHESGKTLQELILEFMQNNPKYSYTWAELSAHTTSLGFNKSSINNGVSRLMMRKLIHKTSPGKYKLSIVEKKST
jgi:hypothetical protein